MVKMLRHLRMKKIW